MISAIAQPSPIAPPLLPISMSIREGSVPSPLLITSRGVADATSSGVIKLVAAPPAREEKAISKNTRAVIAGFAKLHPRPPKTHFTITIATTEPTRQCHTVAFVERLSAKSKPVTIALRSPMVCSFFVRRLKMYSAPTEEARQTAIMSAAEKP